jgi:hypothetical protein
MPVLRIIGFTPATHLMTVTHRTLVKTRVVPVRTVLLSPARMVVTGLGPNSVSRGGGALKEAAASGCANAEGCARIGITERES